MFFQVIFCGINDFFRPLPRLPFQSGIREIIYLSDKYATTPGTLASKRMLKSAGITIRRLESDKTAITLPLSES